MRVHTAFLLLFIALGVANAETVSYVQDRNGIAYLPNQDTPFTGQFVSVWEDGHGQIKTSGSYKNGRQDGKWEWWNSNGQKVRETFYKDGLVNGVQLSWSSDGNKSAEVNFKSGLLHGKTIGWYSNGNMVHQRNYINGVRDGKWIGWHENGNKRYEIIYKDGKKDDLVSWWDVDGAEIQAYEITTGLLYDHLVAMNVKEQLSEKGYIASINKSECPDFTLKLPVSWSSRENATEHEIKLIDAGARNISIVPFVSNNKDRYMINIGRFEDISKAKYEQERLKENGHNTTIINDHCFVVNIGAFTSGDATKTIRKLSIDGFEDIKVNILNGLSIVNESPVDSDVRKSGSTWKSDATRIDPAYLKRMRVRLRKSTFYPIIIRDKLGVGGRVEVGYVIDRSGMLLYVEVSQSSGYAELDQAVVEMVEMAQPFEPLPDSFKSDRAAFSFPVGIPPPLPINY